MPSVLKRLWEAKRLGDLERLELLDSLDVLEKGYGEAIASESEDIAANVRAHRRVFARLGFFARTVGDELLALDIGGPDSEDPAVARLDSEGMYSWLGRNIAPTPSSRRRIEAIDKRIGSLVMAWKERSPG